MNIHVLIEPFGNGYRENGENITYFNMSQASNILAIVSLMVSCITLVFGAVMLMISFSIATVIIGAIGYALTGIAGICFMLGLLCLGISGLLRLFAPDLADIEVFRYRWEY